MHRARRCQRDRPGCPGCPGARPRASPCGRERDRASPRGRRSSLATLQHRESRSESHAQQAVGLHGGREESKRGTTSAPSRCSAAGSLRSSSVMAGGASANRIGCLGIAPRRGARRERRRTTARLVATRAKAPTAWRDVRLMPSAPELDNESGCFCSVARTLANYFWLVPRQLSRSTPRSPRCYLAASGNIGRSTRCYLAASVTSAHDPRNPAHS